LTENFTKIVLYNRLLFNEFDFIDEPINRVNPEIIKEKFNLPNEIIQSLISFDGTEIIENNPLIKELFIITQILFDEIKKIEFYKSIIEELYKIFFDNYRRNYL